MTSEQPELLENMHCSWDFGNGVNEDVYVDSLEETDSFLTVHDYEQAAIGRRDVTANCSNMMSYQLLSHTVEVIWDQVILDSFSGGSPVWRTNVSSLTLTLTRFGTHSCFKFEMGDGNTTFYGRPWCASQEPALTLIPLEHDTMEFQVNYTYGTSDIYTASAYAFNHGGCLQGLVADVVEGVGGHRVNIEGVIRVVDLELHGVMLQWNQGQCWLLAGTPRSTVECCVAITHVKLEAGMCSKARQSQGQT